MYTNNNIGILYRKQLYFLNILHKRETSEIITGHVIIT